MEIGTETLNELRNTIDGQVVLPDDSLYENARLAWNRSVDPHPRLIVLPKSELDIIAAINYARHNNLGVAVQSTGHGVVRPADDCMLINTSQMTKIRVNETTQTAWLQAGVKWGQVLEKTHQVGLAPLLGSSPDVGAVGYTMGGGLGWLGRKYGLAVDSVKSLDIVTSDGQLHHANLHENSDLFWGLRGGGGSLGVVASMEIQLFPVSEVYAGNLIYPIELAAETFRRYRQWIKTAPDELTTSVLLMNFPPMPLISEILRGKSFVIVRGCFCGHMNEGEKILEFWRDWQTPLMDDFRWMSFSDVGTISNDPVEPLPAKSSGAWISELSDEVINILIRYGTPQNGRSPLTVSEVRHAGGAISRVDPDSAAYGNRDASLILNTIAMTPTAEIRQQAIQNNQNLMQDLQPYLTGRVYINFLDGEESQKRIEDAYSSDTFQQLVELKNKYDPDNILRFSFNIQPG